MGSQSESGRTVADVLSERAALDDGERAEDGAKVALVVEGGGMRGSISAEIVAELADRGIVDLLDIVVGTSAGAVNAVATAADVIDTVAATYSDVFASPKFASPYRALRLKPMVDTSAIVDEMDRRTSFARIAFEAPRVDFALVATDVEEASTVTLDNFSDRDDVCRSITASATLPLMGGRPVRHRGRRLLDGGIMEAVPIAAAKNLGATHAIVVITRPPQSLPVLGGMDRLVARYLDRVNSALGRQWRGRPDRYAALREKVVGGNFEGVATTLIGPGADDCIPSRMESDHDVLRRARADARRSAAKAIEKWGLAPDDTNVR